MSGGGEGGSGPLARRLAPLLLAGAAVAALWLWPSVPHEHHVTLRLHAPETVTGIELAWAPLPAGTGPAGEATQGGSWHFAPGGAPATVQTRVQVPDGPCELDGMVERGSVHESFHRVVHFGDGDDITVPLH